MKLIDKMLQSKESSLVWSDIQRENRLGSISQNAVQQARIPYGRGDDPFTDGDYQAQHDILLILSRLERKEQVQTEHQHQLLTPVAEPDIDPVLAEVANVITHPRNAEFHPTNHDDDYIRPTDDAA